MSTARPPHGLTWMGWLAFAAYVVAALFCARNAYSAEPGQVNGAPVEFALCDVLGASELELCVEYTATPGECSPLVSHIPNASPATRFAIRPALCAPFQLRYRGVSPTGIPGGWSPLSAELVARPDLNADGVVGIGDFAELAVYFGAAYGISDFSCMASASSYGHLAPDTAPRRAFAAACVID